MALTLNIETDDRVLNSLNSVIAAALEDEVRKLPGCSADLSPADYTVENCTITRHAQDVYELQAKLTIHP